MLNFLISSIVLNMPDFYTIIIVGCIFLSLFLIYIIFRRQRDNSLFFDQYKISSRVIVVMLSFGIIIGFYTRFIEPNQIQIKNTTIKINGLNNPIKIAFIADPQINAHKNLKWINKINTEVNKIKPDLLIFGGDLIDNEGNTYQKYINGDAGDSGDADEVGTLSGFSNIISKQPSYFVLGNHEYGLGNLSRTDQTKWTANRASDTTQELEYIGAYTITNKLKCSSINKQPICLFGIDDVWGDEMKLTKIDFSELKNWDQKTPLIFITHNPDGILYWPKDIKKPDLVLAGHTHGGQIYLPFIGPLGDAGLQLGKQYYRGLNYYNNIPIYTSLGLGESGGPIRFMAVPELTVVNLNK